jgi:hypothetical protein
VRACIVFLSLLCLTACSSPQLKARTFYTSRKDLASYVLDTPDPEKSTTGLGQVIWVRWLTPRFEKDTVIDATIRFKDGTEKNTVYPLSTRGGWLMIEIPSEEREEHGNLLCYKILLRRGNTILTSTKHKLWVEKIDIKDL